MKARGVGRCGDHCSRSKHVSEIKRTRVGPGLGSALPIGERYLVDPASSHMLDSKTKPCMYKYMHFLLQNRGWLIKSVEVP